LLEEASHASDVGSIPIARSINHDDSIVLTPLNQLNTAIKPDVWSQDGPNEINWSQGASVRSWTQMDAAAINWTLPWRRSSESVSLNVELENR
jgi:hypothetical protein